MKNFNIVLYDMSKFILNSNGLLLLTGAKAALGGTPGERDSVL